MRCSVILYRSVLWGMSVVKNHAGNIRNAATNGADDDTGSRPYRRSANSSIDLEKVFKTTTPTNEKPTVGATCSQ
jgi:hypothetical protein